MKIRPIISGINGPTTRLSRLVDFYLQPIAATSPSFIRDSKHFIRFLEDTVIPEDAILVTMDVKDLNTTIPQREGIAIVLKFLHQDSAAGNYQGVPSYCCSIACSGITPLQNCSYGED